MTIWGSKNSSGWSSGIVGTIKSSQRRKSPLGRSVKVMVIAMRTRLLFNSSGSIKKWSQLSKDVFDSKADLIN